MWKVVIIDDDDKVLRGMKKIIPWKQLSCEWAGEARNGQEGLELIKQVKPDLIITDIYMPVMNGLEMIENLRQEDIHSRVIILSGYNDFEYARRAMKLNIDDYLSKPSSPDTINEVLEESIAKLEKEVSERIEVFDLREKVKMYEPLVEKEWIKSIVTGTNTHAASLPPAANRITEKWDQQHHVVITLTYDHSLEESSFFRSDWYLFRFSAENVIKDSVLPYFEDMHYIELHSHQTALCIHFYPGSHQNYEQELAELQQTLVKNFETYFGIHAVTSAGKIKSDWREMSASMKEAFAEISTGSLLHPVNKTAPEQNPEIALVEESQRDLWSNSMEAKQKMSEAIRYADIKNAEAVIDSIYEQHKETPFDPRENLRLGIEVWTIITYSLYDIGIKIDEMFSEKFDFHRELAKAGNWMEFRSYLHRVVHHICENQQWDENLKHRQLVEQMLAYIQKNISENITLQDIADELLISRNYLGQIFKKIVGESFKNYLTRVRMEKAKKMIQEGSYLIYEISEQVGFTNPAYFTSTFKKYTGYTPTELINRRTAADPAKEKSRQGE
ncbi:response regulator transcription factor [Alkalicoccus daliensis]|uniref:Two component transcriptional regulator, AraC family n=1 Tax=Alkalicoccus daliensis TaxID=745820 RepID=A0A1H0EZE6_9BACI|nr:response regulator transcription factor [Alkalicoccus daliensis]SDN87774.1 two component transcriptional regulator, AraC family [Alkalicoccus daliensis]